MIKNNPDLLRGKIRWPDGKYLRKDTPLTNDICNPLVKPFARLLPDFEKLFVNSSSENTKAMVKRMPAFLSSGAGIRNIVEGYAKCSKKMYGISYISKSLFYSEPILL